jgi:hypothetical protein
MVALARLFRNALILVALAATPALPKAAPVQNDSDGDGAVLLIVLIGAVLIGSALAGGQAAEVPAGE